MGELVDNHDRRGLSGLPEERRYQSGQTTQWCATLSLSELHLPADDLSADVYRSGPSAGTQRRIVEMALNGSGIRDTARVLRVSPVTVLRVLKKRVRFNFSQSSGVGHPRLRGHGRTASKGGGRRSRRNVVLCR